jgi:hypothetical protein
MEPPDLEVDFVHPGSVSLLYLVFLFDILRYEQILDLCDPRPFFRGKTGPFSGSVSASSLGLSTDRLADGAARVDRIG